MLPTSLRMAATGLLRIGSLPSRQLLRELHQAGFRRYLNLSGVDLHTVYPTLPPLTIRLFFLADVFSSPPVPVQPIAQDYLRHVPAEQTQAFLQAVTVLRAWLAEGRAVYVFCYQGEGRSPAVALAALCGHFQLPLDTARELVHVLRPQAKITAMSLAAAKWAGESSLYADRASYRARAKC